MKNIFKFIKHKLILCSIIGMFFSCMHKQNKHTTEDVNAEKLPWHLGIQLWTFHLYPFITAIEKADSCQLTRIEAYSGEPIGGVYTDSFTINMSDNTKKFVKQLLAKKKMQLIGFGVLNPLTKSEWDKIFKFSKEMGIQIIIAEPLREHLDYADSLANVYGIKIAIHNHPKPALYWHPDSVLAATKNHSNIFACADIGHWERSGLNPVECIQKLNGKIADVHLKDVDGFNNINANNAVLGKGIIDLNAVFNELKKQQYSGQISIEHEQNWLNNVPDVKENIQWYNSEMNKLFN